jgi:hypothetical protein
MSPEHARQLQTEFLAGFEAKLSGRGELPVPGGGDILSLMDLKREVRRADRWSEVRRAALAAGKADRALFDRLPMNPSAAVHFVRRGLFRDNRLLTVAAATVADFRAFAEGREPGPAGLPELLDALAGVSAATTAPALVGVFSPTGWSPEAVAGIPDDLRRRVALVQRHPDGGWQVLERDGRTTTLTDLFDPEPESRKFSRTLAAVKSAIEALPVGEPLPAAELAAKARLPVRMVAMVMEDLVSRAGDLRTLEAGGRTVLYRTPISAQPASPLQRIWPFAQGDAERLEVLGERRVRLQLLRRQAFDEIDKLAAEEGRLMEAGRSASTDGERRRVAARLATLRREADHRRKISDLIGRQLDILSGHLHNIELASLGRSTQTPTAEEIKEAGEKARQALDELTAALEAVDANAPDAAETAALSVEEDKILREFEADRQRELDALVIKPLPVAETPRTEPPKKEAAERPRRAEAE